MLAGSVILVLIVELLNSGIEAAIDRVSFELHELSKRAKDLGIKPLGIHRGFAVAPDPSLNDAAQAAIDACFDSNDFKEGLAAFHARRAPSFTGN